MKLYNKAKAAALAFGVLMFVSCGDFLNQPVTDDPSADTFYESDEACYQGANTLYNIPWNDCIRGYIRLDVLAGNYYMYGDEETQWWNGSVTSTNENLGTWSTSLWAVNAYANLIKGYVAKSSGASESVKNACIGECLTWKALAYFFLVRSFGPVPIVHDSGEMISNGTYNDVYKAKIENVYDYIIKNLESAIKLLPEKDNTGLGRIDKYAAMGLLAKVYLAKSGFDPASTTYEGTGAQPYIKTTAHKRNVEELALAAKYAKEVIDNSGRELEPVYSDAFRGAYVGDESLISWHWAAVRDPWGCQNQMQCELGPHGFNELGEGWGEWSGPSVDLTDAFGVDLTEQPTHPRKDNDDRRQGTIMMAGDVYDYFYTDKGGFDLMNFLYKKYEDFQSSPGYWTYPTGGGCVKHLIGDRADHQKYVGTDFMQQAYGNYTPILRLADVYLIYAEAMIGDNGSTSDASAIDAFYKVRHRSVKNYQRPASISYDDVWKERRLELAVEGDRWYDYVRRFYYDPDGAINELNSQRRNEFYNLRTLYETWYNDGGYDGAWDVTAADARYNDDPGKKQNFTVSSFTLPFPSSDVKQNPHLLEAPQDIDITQFSFE